MKTISFYSYKGGVGRSLALAYIAKELARLNLGICILDIDLEAPGIIYKFEEEPDPLKYGVLDYIYSCVIESQVPNNLEESFFKTVYQASDYGYVKVMNAGRGINTKEYWDKLSKIDWNKLFIGNNNEGLYLFENLKGIIEKQIKPDYLLIDSRSGVTVMSKVCNSVLPDTVIMFLAKNNENFNGSKMMYNHIANSANYKVNKKNTDIFCAITRIPSYNAVKENVIIDEFMNKINNPILKKPDISIIHSDRDVEYEELLLIQKKQDNKRQIIGDYLKIADKIADKELIKKRNVSKAKYRFIENELDTLTVKELNALKEKPHQYQTFFENALHERNKGNIIRAIANLCEIIDSNTELKLNALYWRGIIYLYDFNNYNDAENDLRTVYNFYNTFNARILYDLAVCYFCLDKHDEALSYVDCYISDINAHDFHGFLLRAVIKGTIFKMNITSIEKNDIISDFDKAIELNLDFVGSYNNRGLFYHMVKETEKALADFNRAIKIDVNYIFAYYNRGILYNELKETEKALEDFNRTIEIDVDYAPVYYNRGNLYSDINEIEKALNDYNKAIEKDPNYEKAYNNRGVLYDKLNETEKALSDYNKAIEIDAGYALVYNNRGVLYGKLNENKKALDDYNKAIEIDPDFKLAYENKDNLYSRLGITKKVSDN
jgi:tetratricopeptide (TPR) repeat protein